VTGKADDVEREQPGNGGCGVGEKNTGWCSVSFEAMKEIILEPVGARRPETKRKGNHRDKQDKERAMEQKTENEKAVGHDDCSRGYIKNLDVNPLFNFGRKPKEGLKKQNKVIGGGTEERESWYGSGLGARWPIFRFF